MLSFIRKFSFSHLSLFFLLDTILPDIVNLFIVYFVKLFLLHTKKIMIQKQENNSSLIHIKEKRHRAFIDILKGINYERLLFLLSLTLSALTRISFPAVARIVLSILVAVPVWRLATRWAAVCDRD